MFKKILSRWFDLSTTEGKLKLFILAGGLMLVVSLSSVAVLGFTSRPEFCAGCHKTMQPEYLTWKVTSHSQVKCTQCHIKPGVVNTLTHKVATLREPLLYFTNSWEKPVKPTEKVENVNCLQCHSQNRAYTVSGDLVVPHERHIKAHIECVDCHAGVAHAMIYERGLTGEKAPVAPEKWTETYARQVSTKQYTSPDMDTCIQCHYKRGKPVSCETCHKTIFTPQDHKDKAKWQSQHGLDAEKNVKTCRNCHNFGFEDKGVKLANQGAAYAWSNTFCRSCHSKAPAGHNNTTWRNEHPEAVAQKGEKNCMACHRPSNKFPDAAPTKVACNQCHYTP